MWLAQPLYVLGELVTAAQATGYSVADDTISDLGTAGCGPGAVCSPWHALLNGSFVAFGLLLALGAVALRRSLPSGSTARASVVLWVVAGAGTIAVGLVPLDRDAGLHALVAVPVFVAQPLALVTLGLALRPRGAGLAWSVVAAGAISLAAACAFAARSGGGDLAGVLERLALWPAHLALAFVAAAYVTTVRSRP